MRECCNWNLVVGTCTVCGEARCEECSDWSAPGAYGHPECIEAEALAAAELRERIVALVEEMPLKSLRRVDELVCYLSPAAQERAHRAHLARKAVGA